MATKNEVQAAFQMPKPIKIMDRSSSITNSFVNGIIPATPPTDAEIIEALEILGMSPDNVQCAYCGDPSTEWDHFMPLVEYRKPTGFISEIRNLVPACGKCNQSKGNKNWRDWATGLAKKSPKSRGVADLEKRLDRLAAYEAWGKLEPLSFKNMIEDEDWKKHWENLDSIVSLMRVANEHAKKLKEQLSSGQKESRTLN